ncbi:MAG: DUF222 domain-containing protein [Propionibacteriaceae bacterium]|nr:DUF222 domain-containing protein [Propionibacteriaceae bacterium]
MEHPQLTLADVIGWVAALGTLSGECSDGERVDRLRALEDVKNAICAAQAREAAALKRSVIEAEAARGVPAARRGRGVAAQVALARRESPHRGGRLLGLAEALVHELPETMAALTRGVIGEWRATVVCRETACLSREDRMVVDRRLAAELPILSDREVEASARRYGYELDPHSVVERAVRAEADRRVTLRPAPEAMTILSATLPVAQGVAVYAALKRAADTARAGGDERGRGQVMADTLVTRCTGQAQADQVPVEVQLVMTDQALLWGGSAPVEVPGYGPIPAGQARRMLAGLKEDTPAWLRRLYVHPRTGQLVAMESKQRCFPDGLRAFLTARDQYCRTPWCGAPVRHADHVIPAAQGGETSAANGQGLCEACNQTKEAPGWQAVPEPDGTVVTTTPTGHSYRSTSPPVPGHRPPVHIDIQFQLGEAA